MDERTVLVVALWVLALGGCSTVRPAQVTTAPELEPVLLGGDLLVALEPTSGSSASILRYRGPADGPAPRVRARLLVEAAGASAPSASPSGRWLAARVEYEDASRVVVWNLRHAELPLTVASAVWKSPAGCDAPRFDPADAFVVMGCPAVLRGGGATMPAHVVMLDLETLRPLALVGDRNRLAPTVGVEGDLYWVERSGGSSLVYRRDTTKAGWAIHRLSDPITRLWPRYDGSLVAEVRVGEGRELIRLGASGTRTTESLRTELGRGPRSTDPVSSTPGGDLVFAVCTREPCGVFVAGSGGIAAPLTVGGRPVGLHAVPRFSERVARPEDLATASATVLTTHSADLVSVLGVELGMPLVDVFEVLQSGGRFPQWIDDSSALGVGAVRGGHCIEFLGNDEARVKAIELSECARSYLSPALQPLFDREVMARGALGLLSRYLGPGVSSQVGDPQDLGREGRSIRGTTLRYATPERGYAFEARTEILRSRRSRFIGGRLLLRLTAPTEDARVGRR